MGPLVEAFNETGMPWACVNRLIEVINQSTSWDAIDQITSAIGDEIEHIDLLNNLQGVHIIAGSSGSGKSMMAGRLAKQMAQQYGEHDVALISLTTAHWRLGTDPTDWLTGRRRYVSRQLH